MKRKHLTGLAVAAASLPLVAPVLAHAGTSSIGDPSGDVWEGDQPAPAAFVNVDLAITNVQHRRRAVVVEATYFEMKRTVKEFYLELGIIAQKGPDGNGLFYRSMTVVDPDHRAGSQSLTGVNGAVDCPGMQHDVDYVENTVDIRIPRTCVDTPRWIQFSASAFKAGRPGGSWYADDGLTAETPHGEFSSRLYRTGSEPEY